MTLDGETDGGFTYGLGFLNSVRGIAPDTNNNKSLIVGKLGWGTDTFSTSRAAVDLGQRGSRQLRRLRRRRHTVASAPPTFMVNWNPTEKFSSWVNATYSLEHEQRRRHHPVVLPDYQDRLGPLGIAAAGRYGVHRSPGPRAPRRVREWQQLVPRPERRQQRHPALWPHAPPNWTPASGV